MTKPLRGVNLGGWLVLEKWITPSLFTGINATDEYGFCQQANKVQRAKLARFRGTFITEADFAWLARHGIEAVRLPVGYWLFGAAAPYVSTVDYVDQAFAWAEKYKLQVIISLHGAPGSQNGQFHSGQAGTMNWLEANNQEQTIVILERIAKRYRHYKVFRGLSLVNEPAKTIASTELEHFYESAYKRLRAICPAPTWLIFSDSFRPSEWRERLPSGDYPGLVVDHHQYQLSSLIDQRLPAWLQIQRARWLLPENLRRMAAAHPLIIGEWSVVLTNGAFGKASVEQRQVFAERYARTQLQAFESAEAWFYWTYKMERPSFWSYQYCVERKILPS